MSSEAFQMSHDELGKITRSMRNSSFRDELASYVDERSDPKHREEEDIFWEESARNGSIPSGNVVIKPKAAFLARTKLRLTNGAYMNFYINVSFSPAMKDLEMEQTAQGQSVKMPQVFSEARLDREDNNDTCQSCTSCVSYKTILMCEAMPELKEVIVDQAIAVMKKKFVGEGENLSPDYEIVQGQKCKGPSPRYCLAPLDYIVENYKKLEAKDIAYPGQTVSGKTHEVVTPQQIESMKRRAQQNDQKESGTETATEEKLISESTSTTKSKAKTQILVGKTPASILPAAPWASEAETGCELTVIEGSRISASPDVEGVDRSSLPSHLIVRVRLPGVTSAGGIDCDVKEGGIFTLRVEGKYAVEKKLNYNVDFGKAAAKFVKQSNELEVTLPVLGATVLN